MPKKRQPAPEVVQQECAIEHPTPTVESSMGLNIKSDQLKLIPFFSGCPSESFNEFEQDFAEVAQMCQWNEGERILALRQKLTAAAKIFVRQQVAPIKSFDQLIALLRQQYSKPRDATELLQEFLAFTQPQNMSVAEYVNKALNLSYKTFRRGELDAHIEEANREQMLKAMLLKNIAPQIRRGVIAANPQSVEEIISRATLEERAWKATHSEEPVETAETPGVFTIATRGIGDAEGKDRIADLQGQVEMLAKRIDTLLIDKQNNRDRQRGGSPPYCNFCRYTHFGRCEEDPNRYRNVRNWYHDYRGRPQRQFDNRQRNQGNYSRYDIRGGNAYPEQERNRVNQNYRHRRGSNVSPAQDRTTVQGNDRRE